MREVLAWAGAVNDAKPRAVPVVFVAHALTGGVALIAGALQFNRRLRLRSRALHRLIGRTYVGAVWISSLGGIWIAIFFDASLAARMLFIVAAVLWFTTTTIALRQAFRRRYQQHREWMIRSFALSLFFATFELWRGALSSSGLPQSIAYPLGLLLGWSTNLVMAEWRIRRTRPVAVRRTTPEATQTVTRDPRRPGMPSPSAKVVEVVHPAR